MKNSTVCHHRAEERFVNIIVIVQLAFEEDPSPGLNGLSNITTFSRQYHQQYKLDTENSLKSMQSLKTPCLINNSDAIKFNWVR